MVRIIYLYFPTTKDGLLLCVKPQVYYIWIGISFVFFCFSTLMHTALQTWYLGSIDLRSPPIQRVRFCSRKLWWQHRCIIQCDYMTSFHVAKQLTMGRIFSIQSTGNEILCTTGICKGTLLYDHQFLKRQPATPLNFFFNTTCIDCTVSLQVSWQKIHTQFSTDKVDIWFW